MWGNEERVRWSGGIEKIFALVDPEDREKQRQQQPEIDMVR